ncbi:MAG: maleylpyruvate isomerase family mycothiol-dependent enzyme [Propionibacteriaceae bacterium]
MTLTVADYRAVLQRAGTELIAAAEAVGPGTPVPTCPGWTVRDLVAHLAMVHAWATAYVRGGHPTGSGETAGRHDPQLFDRYRRGLAALLAAVRDAPEDLDAPRFLADPPPARVFWARRQAHETVIHGVDARAALLGRAPAAAETRLPRAVALDGVDELLRGFLPRTRTRLRSDEPYTVTFRAADPATDSDTADTHADAWTVHVSSEPVVTVPGGDPTADTVITGSPVALYLGLWNRGDELSETGRPGVLAQWRAQQRIGW